MLFTTSMILVTHSLIGVAATKSLDNSWLIFAAAFLIHFVFDAIPHYHYDISAVKNIPKEKNKFGAVLSRVMTPSFLKIASDFLLAFILPFVFLGGTALKTPLPILLAIVGSLLPDFLGGLWWMGFPSRALSAYQSFHHKVHLGMEYFLKGRPILGMSFNIVYTLIAIYFVLW